MLPFLTSLVVAADSGNEKAVQQVDIFQGGTECYHTYRIPAIVLSSKNTLLAFCEGRKTSDNDAGDVDLMLRRSSDGGKTWRPMQLVYEKGGSAEVTIGNPCPVVDRTTGTIWLPFCRNNDRVFITKSKDDDLTWSKPVHHEQVYCPTCQASIQRYSRPPGGKNRILYSGPGGPGRNNMTIRQLRRGEHLAGRQSALRRVRGLLRPGRFARRQHRLLVRAG